jgi:G3E family GTPase
MSCRRATRPRRCSGRKFATASLAFPGTVSSDALEAWLDHTIGLLGPMLLRMKAMLDIENAQGPTVLHAVRGLLHQPVDLKAWPTPDRQNRVVLIGSDVEQQILMDCLARLASAAMPVVTQRAG